MSPGTVIISTVGEVSDVRKCIEPVLVKDCNTRILHIDLSFDSFKLGGSSFAQSIKQLGDEAPSVMDVDYFKDGFSAIQQLINEGLILSGHDISAGGMVTALLELCFANKDYGLKLDLSAFEEDDLVKLLFSENPGVIIQVRD